jgi:hypothetical protein
MGEEKLFEALRKCGTLQKKQPRPIMLPGLI